MNDPQERFADAENVSSLRKAPIIGIVRHRIETDGEGVTTLVGFHGCPLRCRYCLNPQSLDPDEKTVLLTPKELLQRVAVDQLYFLASGGGIVFGGGEPLLRIPFLREFRSLAPKEWMLWAETSLNVPEENVRAAAEIFDRFIVDCKDTDPGIYRRYTGTENERMLSGLRRLLSLVTPERVTVRLPLIPGYNDDTARDRSERILREMGVTVFDRMEYVVRSGAKDRTESGS